MFDKYKPQRENILDLDWQASKLNNWCYFQVFVVAFLLSPNVIYLVRETLSLECIKIK